MREDTFGKNMEYDFPFYRITHIDNVASILRDGMWSTNSGHVDEGYKFIGEPDLTRRRSLVSVTADPRGVLGDYVPFYFGARSPMLYNIQRSHNLVQRRSASEIVYLCFRRSVLEELQLRWCFTDGHAKMAATKFYTSEDSLNVIDNKSLIERNWGTRGLKERDPDLRHRKQAELLIHHKVPGHAVRHIIVASDAALQTLKQIVSSSPHQPSVTVASPYDRFYY